MPENLSKIDRRILRIISRVRGLRPEHAVQYRALLEGGSVEALRKRMSRLVDSGFLALSKLPDGRLLYRLSHKGVRVVNASAAFATSPTPAICAEMLAKMSLGMRDDFWFLTKSELEILFRELDPETEPPVTAGSFILRRMPTNEKHLHFWLSELRPADELRKRTEIIIEKLRHSPLFSELIETHVFGFTVVVPSASAKVAFQAKPLSIETEVEVCEELQSIISLS